MDDGAIQEPQEPNSILPRYDTTAISYFFDRHIKFCIAEQAKIFGTVLLKEEKNASISYPSEFSLLLNFNNSQVNPILLSLILGDKGQINIDGFIDDLRTLAANGGPGDVIRLLDLLLINRRFPEVSREMTAHSFRYDLWAPDSRMSGIDILKTVNSALANVDAAADPVKICSLDLALHLAMIASSDQTVIETGLFYLAKRHGYAWDALIIARSLLDPEGDTCEALHRNWLDSLKQERTIWLHYTRRLLSGDVHTMAELLINTPSERKNPLELILAYRCYAIILAQKMPSNNTMDSKLKIQILQASMRAIYMSLCAFAAVDAARAMAADVAERASPMDIPCEIFKECLVCHLELLEVLLAEQNLLHGSPSMLHNRLKQDKTRGLLAGLALLWRERVTKRTSLAVFVSDSPIEQKVLYSWLDQIVLTLRIPVVEMAVNYDRMAKDDKEVLLVQLSTELLPQLIKYACTEDATPLVLSLAPASSPAHTAIHARASSDVMPDEEESLAAWRTQNQVLRSGKGQRKDRASAAAPADKTRATEQALPTQQQQPRQADRQYAQQNQNQSQPNQKDGSKRVDQHQSQSHQVSKSDQDVSWRDRGDRQASRSQSTSSSVQAEPAKDEPRDENQPPAKVPPLVRAPASSDVRNLKDHPDLQHKGFHQSEHQGALTQHQQGALHHQQQWVPQNQRQGEQQQGAQRQPRGDAVQGEGARKGAPRKTSYTRKNNHNGAGRGRGGGGGGVAHP